MRFAVVVRSLVSGIVVYVVAAACGASEKVAVVVGDGGGLDAVADVLVDDLGNPVGDAHAEPPPPEVATEKCDKVLNYLGADTYFAVHEYPGQTAEELSAVRTLLPAGSPEGFKYQWAAPLVGDGRVAVNCGRAAPGPQPTFAVTFVRPK